MSRFSTPRLLAQGMLRTFTKPQYSTRSAPQWARLFSQSPVVRADNPPPPPPQSSASMDSLARSFVGNLVDPSKSNSSSGNLGEDMGIDPLAEDLEQEPYHFHIYSHKHNTHVTVTKPNRDALISLSCGNLGFKHSGRKHYDSAYQLGAYVIDKMHQKGLTKKIHKLEVILRGFGAGREAVVKVLMGNEGKALRDKIVKVSDSTRIKFGGTRSKKPRRLG
ncbi:hypothetical protein QBC40DRAFT_273874 [Triangularia verruculosa]|uniref:Small ribosomal subunit protein uS11m n=1 Tax=Triangularia verruculosa TaxID=2587418 RepID=A0AAN7AYA1_9PEZI|nr:hypothetical protein QBC40DRAFT_273874 [Triangularia verruculosa]